MRATAEIVIERPMQAVWDWAADPRHWQQWEPDLGDVDAAPGDRITSSYVYGEHSGTAEYEVVEQTPPRRQVVRSVSGPFRFEGTLELSEALGGTLVRQTVVAGPDSPLTRVVFVIARPLVRRGMRRRIAAQLVRLKEMAELGAAL
jgi:polyketide cyclase/dehydrase/lipid transport protein